MDVSQKIIAIIIILVFGVLLTMDAINDSAATDGFSVFVVIPIDATLLGIIVFIAFFPTKEL